MERERKPDPEQCPFRVSEEGEPIRCFDPMFLADFEPAPEITEACCEGNFRDCPHYLAHRHRLSQQRSGKQK